MSQNTNYYFDDDRVFSDSHPAQPEAVAPPDNALWIAPPESCPAGSAMVARADRSGWEIVPDYRAVGAYDQQGQWRRVQRPGPLPEGWTAEPPPPTAEEIADQQVLMAQAEAGRIINAGLQRQAAQTMAFSAAEFTVFALAGIFDPWAAAVEYPAGTRLAHQDRIYEVITAHTAQAHQPPDAAGMLAVYRPLSVEPDGTLADPIIFIYGMDVTEGKYYRHNGLIYLARGPVPACVWPPDTEGMWQWEVVHG